MGLSVCNLKLAPFFTVTLSVKNLVGDSNMCEFVIYDKNPQLTAGVWECGTNGKCQGLDKHCCSHYFCVCPTMHHPSFLQRGGELVVIVLDTSCLLKPFHEGPQCTLVEVKNAAFLLWSGFCFLYCKIAFIFAFDLHWMSLCIITVMFCW